jgi:hypothetical protein
MIGMEKLNWNALDATAEGDFLHCDGDQAFNIIKKLITIYSMPTDFDSSLVSIFNIIKKFEYLL